MVVEVATKSKLSEKQAVDIDDVAVTLGREVVLEDPRPNKNGRKVCVTLMLMILLMSLIGATIFFGLRSHKMMMELETYRIRCSGGAGYRLNLHYATNPPPKVDNTELLNSISDDQWQVAANQINSECVQQVQELGFDEEGGEVDLTDISEEALLGSCLKERIHSLLGQK